MRQSYVLLRHFFARSFLWSAVGSRGPEQRALDNGLPASFLSLTGHLTSNLQSSVYAVNRNVSVCRRIWCILVVLPHD